MAISAYERVKEWRARPENKGKRAEEARRWRIKHPELAKEIKERYQAANREKIRIEGAERAAKKRKYDPEGQKRRNLAYQARLVAWKDEVAGRKKPEACDECGGNSGGIVFDHCHSTGNFRGWLCDRCNKTLGMVKDDPELLERLAAYLRRTGFVKTDYGEKRSPAKEGFRDPRQEGLPFV